MKTFTRFVQLDTEYLPFRLECGVQLEQLTIAYETYGVLNQERNNVILICHALTGDAHAAGISDRSLNTELSPPISPSTKPLQPGWWDGMIGSGKTFDTERFYVICVNILGSCYGTTGPADINPRTGKRYGPDFPPITPRDMVRVQYLLLRELGIRHLKIVSGGSLGGMQTLEWAIMYPDFLDMIIPIGTAARHSDWCIGINHLARQAIINDPAWKKGRYQRQPAAGLALAREIAMVSYRADKIFNQRFQNEHIYDQDAIFDQQNIFQVENYLNYQGEKLVKRFDANTYLCLSHAMDRHDVGRDRGGVQQALNSIQAAALCIGIDSDILYPASEQQEIARFIPNSSYAEISSVFGHDAFLVEFDQLKRLITSFIANQTQLNKGKAV